MLSVAFSSRSTRCCAAPRASASTRAPSAVFGVSSERPPATVALMPRPAFCRCRSRSTSALLYRRGGLAEAGGRTRPVLRSRVSRASYLAAFCRKRKRKRNVRQPDWIVRQAASVLDIGVIGTSRCSHIAGGSCLRPTRAADRPDVGCTYYDMCWQGFDKQGGELGQACTADAVSVRARPPRPQGVCPLGPFDPHPAPEPRFSDSCDLCNFPLVRVFSPPSFRSTLKTPKSLRINITVHQKTAQGLVGYAGYAISSLAPGRHA